MKKILVPALITIALFLPSELTAQKSDGPDPRELLEHVATVRNQISSGHVEIEVSKRWFNRPYWSNAGVHLDMVFDGAKRRVKSIGPEYSYYLMGDNTSELTHAKMDELGLDFAKAVSHGLFIEFQALNTSYFDGERLIQYAKHGNELGTTSIKDPSRGSAYYLFDPRVLGISGSFFSGSTVETCLFLDKAEQIRLLGKDTVNGRPTWRVQVEITVSDRPLLTEFWIDVERPERVLQMKDLARDRSILSEYDEISDPLPKKIHLMEKRNGTPFFEHHFVVHSRKYNIEIQERTWDLEGLEMPRGVQIIDETKHRRLGYWTGSIMSSTRPKGLPSFPKENAPHLNKLLDLVTQDPKSEFAVKAVTRTLLYEPPGPAEERALRLFKSEQTKEPDLADFCWHLPRTWKRPTWTMDILRLILKENPHPKIQAIAAFKLASMLKNKARDGIGINEAEQLFQKVSQEHPEVVMEGDNLAELATEALEEIRLQARLGEMAPNIAGTDLEGQKMQLADFKGRVVVLSFWAGWCGPCMKRIPEERELVNHFAGKPFVFIGVNGDSNRDQAAALARKEKMNWRSFWDHGSNGTISTTWGVHSWPTTFIIDTEGRIRFRNLFGEEMNQAVNALLPEIPEKL